MHVTVFSDKKKEEKARYILLEGIGKRSWSPYVINKKSEGTLIEEAMELRACSPGLLKKMKPTAQDSKLRRIVRLYIRDFGGNWIKGKS